MNEKQNQHEREVDIQLADGNIIHGTLALTPGAQGLVLFAHGSGSSRFSSRNHFVALHLQEKGLATLLIDLLTRHEEYLDLRSRRFRFDIALLAERVKTAATWASRRIDTTKLALGLFGASTGAAAALVAAADLGDKVQAVVSRGGRPDLAMEALPQVISPTLLIVGDLDTPVIDMNRRAFDGLVCEKKLELIPGATHLFEEPGTLKQVAELAGGWFVDHLCRQKKSAVR